MRPFRELDVWQLSHDFTLKVYAVTEGFPRQETYGLTSQLRRAAYSVPMNIAEGSARSPKEFHQSLRIALGSAAELEYGLLLARELGYLTVAAHDPLDAQLASVKRMLVSFMAALRRANQ